MVALLDELEKAGLATRDRSAEDRRRNLLALTPSGKRVLEEMHALSLETERPVRDALSENELKTLFDLTERAYQAVIADDLRAAEEDAGPDKAAQAASSSDGSSAPALVRRGRSPRFGLSRI
jgi:DNA-binding PadR family transcriptional regulator